MWIIIRSFIQTLTLPVNSVKFYGPKWLVQVSHIVLHILCSTRNCLGQFKPFKPSLSEF